MPGAVAPLSLITLRDKLNFGPDYEQIKYWMKPTRRFGSSRCIVLSNHHLIFNWTVAVPTTFSEFNKCAGDLAVLGKVVPEMTVDHYLEQNDMAGKVWQQNYEIRAWIRRFLPSESIQQFENAVASFHVAHPTDPVALLDIIETYLDSHSKTASRNHSTVSFNGLFYPIIMMTILDKTLNWDSQLYQDMATALSTCPDVLSAEVPAMLQELAASIKDDDEANERFRSMNRSDAAKWLLSDESNAHGVLFRKFIAKHGHRCIRESDIREKSWEQEPEKVVDAIQTTLAAFTGTIGTGKTKKPELSIEEAIESIKTPTTKVKRMLLRFFLRKARVAVSDREKTKSLWIKMLNHCRKAYYCLAANLTSIGFLPEEDLLFFLTPDELRTLVRKRSPKLVSRAIRRRKVFQQQIGLKFPDIVSGHIEPHVSNKATSIRDSDLTLSGMAVGNGCIEGTARVIVKLADAHEIQNNDILIARYTDVGWSPYFPMISGLVTELGGLISHGAVIAREYGLPCLVGVKQATQYIKTGDRVRIDGNLGQLYVLQDSKSE